MILQSFPFGSLIARVSAARVVDQWQRLPRRDRAASAVGAGETGHVAGAGGEGEVVDDGDRAVAFGELLYFDHVWHARSGRLGGASVMVTGFAGWSCPAVR